MAEHAPPVHVIGTKAPSSKVTTETERRGMVDSRVHGGGPDLTLERGRVAECADVLFSQLAREEFCGWDPYDALLSPAVRRLAAAKALRQLAIQVNRRSPLNMRRLARVPPRRHAMGTAIILSALAERPELGGQGVDALGRELRNDLISRKIQFDGGVGYGYDFDVQTRWSYYKGGTPNAVVSAFVLHALVDYERLEPLADRDDVDAIVAFACSSLQAVESERGFFAYYPGATTQIHNANVMIAGAVARAVSADSEAWRVVCNAVDHALRHQRPDGSWPYGERRNLDWVDGYHTAFILDGLFRRYEVDSDARTLEAIEHGLDFYLSRLVDPDGAPRATVERRHPIDIHAAAFGVIALARLAHRDERALQAATRTLVWALDNMLRRDGRFAYQLNRHYRCSVPYTRWSDAPMLLALASYLNAAEHRE